MRRWMLWIPVLMVAAVVYWTLALGLGGLSLMALTALSSSERLEVVPRAANGGCTEMGVRDRDDTIVVHIEESDDEAVADEAADDEADEAKTNADDDAVLEPAFKKHEK